MLTTQSALPARRAKTGTGVPCPYNFSLMSELLAIYKCLRTIDRICAATKKRPRASVAWTGPACTGSQAACGRQAKAGPLQHCLLVSNRIATLDRYSISQGLLIGVADIRAGDGTSMFLVLWEFEVKPGREQRFQKVYGPGGDWDSLFHSDPNHAETRLFQTRRGAVCTSLLTTGFPEKLTRHSLNFGEANTKH